MYTQITIVGNVGNEPELRFTPSGTPVCNFNVAVNRTWKSADGESQQKVTWYRIQAWQRQAEICAEYVKKGDRVLVVSENVEANAWIDREGKAQGNIQLVPRLVRFLTPKSEHPGDIAADDATAVTDENPFS